MTDWKRLKENDMQGEKERERRRKGKTKKVIFYYINNYQYSILTLSFGAVESRGF